MLSQVYKTQFGQLVLLAAADALRNMDHRMIEELGLGLLDRETADRLQSLTTDRIAYLNNFKGSVGQFRIDPNGVRLFLGLAESKVTEDELINRAINAGMRQPMLEQLKGVSRREYTARRERMGLPEHARGRIEVLDQEKELLVLRTWQKLEHISDPLLRYVTLHEETRVGLDQAFITINNMA